MVSIMNQCMEKVTLTIYFVWNLIQTNVSSSVPGNVHNKMPVRLIFHLTDLQCLFIYVTSSWTFVFSLQAIGQVLYLRPYVNDFSTQWVLTSVTLLTLGSGFTTYIGERISDLKLGNGTSLLIFTSIISYLPASFGRTVAQAFQDGNYVGLVTIIISFFLLVLGIVYVQVTADLFGKKLTSKKK